LKVWTGRGTPNQKLEPEEKVLKLGRGNRMKKKKLQGRANIGEYHQSTRKKGTGWGTMEKGSQKKEEKPHNELSILITKYLQKGKKLRSQA